MKASTRFWFRFIRIRVAIGMVAVFGLFLFITLGDPPLDPEYLPLIPLVGFMAALCMGLHGLLSTTMFPVTNREMAWIPMTAWGLVSLAGAAGVLSGQLWAAAFGAHIHYYNIPPYWAPAFKIWPFAVFPLLIMWHGLRCNPGFVGFLAFAPMLMIHKVTDSKANLIRPEHAEVLRALWPLWTLGCIFLVWAAPRQMAMLRRLDTQLQGSSLIKMRVPQFSGDGRPSFATRLVDGLMVVVLLGLIAAMVVGVLQTPWSQLRSNPSILFMLALIAIPLVFLGGIWRAARASGLQPLQVLGVLLVAPTGFGYSFRRSLGVAHGTPVPCNLCGQWRFAWQPACPHCHDEEAAPLQPTIAVTVPQRGISAVLFPRHDPEALMFRVMVPIQILVIALTLH